MRFWKGGSSTNSYKIRAKLALKLNFNDFLVYFALFSWQQSLALSCIICESIIRALFHHTHVLLSLKVLRKENSRLAIAMFKDSIVCIGQVGVFKRRSDSSHVGFAPNCRVIWAWKKAAQSQEYLTSLLVIFVAFQKKTFSFVQTC